MDYILLFGLFPENYKKEIEKQSKGFVQYAADVFQWSLVKGIDHFKQTKIINLPYVGSFPETSGKFFFPSFQFQHKDGANDLNVGFLNLQYVKHYFRYLAAKRTLINELKKYNHEITIIIYSLNSPFLKAAVDVKKKFKNVKLCLIAPDLPEFMYDGMNFSHKVFRYIDDKIINKNINHIDAFVFLTNEMASYLGVDNKPNVTVEGIFNKQLYIKTTMPREKYTVFYSGTLARKYGILNLLEAFSKIENKEYRLWICGDGDTNEIIKQASIDDRRIVFMGKKPHTEILELQQRATVLVNPRTSEGEFTKYSFPSKTMEYLASGTPTILFKLSGIPEEYFDYCFTVEDEVPIALKNKIVEVCNLSEKEREQFGLNAQRFIFENKNPKVQCEKIIKMLDLI